MKVKDLKKENKRLKNQVKELAEIIRVRLKKLEDELGEIKGYNGGSKKRSAILPMRSSVNEIVTDKELSEKLTALEPKLTNGLKDGDGEGKKTRKK